MNYKLYALCTSCIFFILGCVSPAPGSPEAVAVALEKEEDLKVAAQKTAIEQTPDWFNEPQLSSNAIYAVGSGDHEFESMARKFAKSQADQALARAISNSLVIRTNTYVDEATQQSLGVSQKLKEAAEAVSEEVLEMRREVKAKAFVLDDGTVRAWQLMMMPLGSVNSAFAEKVKKDAIEMQDERAKASMKELAELISAN